MRAPTRLRPKELTPPTLNWLDISVDDQIGIATLISGVNLNRIIIKPLGYYIDSFSHLITKEGLHKLIQNYPR